MPYLWESLMNIRTGIFIGRVLYPYGVSFLLPAFVIILVKEKENKVLVMMRMKLRLIHDALYPFLHSIRHQFRILCGKRTSL